MRAIKLWERKLESDFLRRFVSFWSRSVQNFRNLVVKKVALSNSLEQQDKYFRGIWASQMPQHATTWASWGILDEADDSPCSQQEETLRTVLTSLGVPDDDLWNVRNPDGVKWMLGSETFFLQKCHFQTNIKRHRWSSTYSISMHLLHFPWQNLKSIKEDQKGNNGIWHTHFVSHIVGTNPCCLVGKWLLGLLAYCKFM